MHTFYYSTEHNARMCKRGYDMINDALKEGNLVTVVLQDVINSPVAQKRFGKNMPVLEVGDETTHGKAAIAKLKELLSNGADTDESVFSESEADSRSNRSNLPGVDDDDGDIDPIDDEDLPHRPRQSHHSDRDRDRDHSHSDRDRDRDHSHSDRDRSHHNGVDPDDYSRFGSVAPVEARYVLYTDAPADQIIIPKNGAVMVTSLKLVYATVSNPHNYIKVAGYGEDQRPPPVLVTLESKPTVWYGIAAEDKCKELCLYNGGIMPMGAASWKRNKQGKRR